MSEPDSFRLSDPAWTRDYLEALAQLNGGFRQPALPGFREVFDEDNPRDCVPLRLPVLVPFSIPVTHQDPDLSNRADVLRMLVVRKTVKVGVRIVLMDGEEIGKIARAFSLGWLASTRRGQVFYSIADACLALFEDHTEAVR